MVKRILRSGTIIGWEQHHTTGECVKKELGYEIQDLSDDQDNTRIVFQLLGGPTGYESFVLKEGDDLYDPARMRECGYWSACAGTKRRWHALRITIDELERCVDEYFLKPDPPHPLHGHEAWAVGIEHKPGEFGMTHGPQNHIAYMLEVTGETNSCIIHFFGDGTEEITHCWKDSEWVAV